jgi:hypothetical protein
MEGRMTTLATISGAVIPAGGSLSSPADCSGSIRVVRLIMPAEWDGASLTFQLSADDGATYRDLYNVTLPGDAFHTYEAKVPRPPPGSVIVVPVGLGGGVSFVKVRSGTALVPIAQSADRAFSFVVEVPDPAPARLRRAAGWAGKAGLVRLGRNRDGSTVAIWHGAGALRAVPPGPAGHP